MIEGKSKYQKWKEKRAIEKSPRYHSSLSLSILGFIERRFEKSGSYLLAHFDLVIFLIIISREQTMPGSVEMFDVYLITCVFIHATIDTFATVDTVFHTFPRLVDWMRSSASIPIDPNDNENDYNDVPASLIFYGVSRSLKFTYFLVISNNQEFMENEESTIFVHFSQCIKS